MSAFFLLILIVYLLATAASVVFFITQEKNAQPVARALLIGAGVLHIVYLVWRYFAAGHTPLTNNHEAVSFFALAMTWGFLSFRWRYQVKNFSTFVTPLLSCLMLVAFFSSQKIHDLPPALQSKWLPVHAAMALMANSFLALAFCGGIMYLIQEKEIKKKRFGLFYNRLPSLDALDNLNHHCLSVGFPLLTMGIITGSLWAKQAWGAYWQWDPKETWSLITWFIYAAILHQRLTVGWRGKRAAIMTIIGFAAALFTLWGVSFLLGGIHSYVG